MPQFYLDLMQKRWNIDPEKRPTAEDIRRLTRSWYNDESMKKIQDQADGIRSFHIKTRKEKPQIHHSKAVYTSRLLPNVSKGKHFR